MKTLTKRELVKRPALVSQLQPGEAIQIEDGAMPIIVARKKLPQLNPEQIEKDIQKLWKGLGPVDCQAVLSDLRE
jgi:hypothetical protein